MVARTERRMKALQHELRVRSIGVCARKAAPQQVSGRVCKRCGCGSKPTRQTNCKLRTVQPQCQRQLGVGSCFTAVVQTLKRPQHGSGCCWG